MPEELVACEVARRVPAPSPWSQLDGLMAQMDNQVRLRVGGRVWVWG